MPDRQLTPIPLHRVATVMPFINYLRQAGVPVERELKSASLPVMAMDDADCFIPSRNYWDFVANVADREGIKPPRDFIGTLKLALCGYLRDGAPTLELAAGIARPQYVHIATATGRCQSA